MYDMFWKEVYEKSGNNLRIIAQLIDALTDTHFWAEKYSGTLDDVFEFRRRYPNQ